MVFDPTRDREGGRASRAWPRCSRRSGGGIRAGARLRGTVRRRRISRFSTWRWGWSMRRSRRYQAGGRVGVCWPRQVLDVAVLFQGQHKQHRGRFWRPRSARRAATGRRAEEDDGVRVAEARQSGRRADVRRQTRGRAPPRRTSGAPQVDPEQGLPDRRAASIMGNEAQHLTVLRQALGENPVPVRVPGLTSSSAGGKGRELPAHSDRVSASAAACAAEEAARSPCPEREQPPRRCRAGPVEREPDRQPRARPEPGRNRHARDAGVAAGVGCCG